MISLPIRIAPIDTMPSKAFWSLLCVIETPKWSVRQGKNWMNVSPADYGYISGFMGADGDEMDCYLGEDLDSDRVFVIDQNRIGDRKTFDEHKCMLGYHDKDAAIQDFLMGHNLGAKIFRGVTELSIWDFINWLKNGNHMVPLSKR